MMAHKIIDVDEYISLFPQSTQEKLQQIRNIIMTHCPNVVESISYAMPAYKLTGKPLIYVAGYQKHIGLYATPSGHAAFAKELARYKQGKGSVQFPLDQDLPGDLIEKIIIFKKEEILKT